MDGQTEKIKILFVRWVLFIQSIYTKRRNEHQPYYEENFFKEDSLQEYDLIVTVASISCSLGAHLPPAAPLPIGSNALN